MSVDLIDSSEVPQMGSFHIYEAWLRLLGRLPRLLVAEDDDETRGALVDLFERGGYDVRAVNDGSSLLYRLEPMLLSEPGHWPPDLILTDVRMPGLDAVNIVEELREVGWDTPVIIVTGFGDQKLRGRINKLENADYFEKPVKADEIEEAVRQAVYASHK